MSWYAIRYGPTKQYLYTAGSATYVKLGRELRVYTFRWLYREQHLAIPQKNVQAHRKGQLIQLWGAGKHMKFKMT